MILDILSCTGQQSSHMNGGSSMPTIHIPQSGAPIVRPAAPSQQQQQLLQQQQKGTVRELLSNQGKLAGDKHFDSNNRQQTTVAALLEQRGQDRLVESGLKNSIFREMYELSLSGFHFQIVSFQIKLLASSFVEFRASDCF